MKLRIVLAIILLLASLFLTMMPINASAQSLSGDTNSISENAEGQKEQNNATELVSNLSKEEINVLSKLLKAITADDTPANLNPAAEQIKFADVLQSTWRDYSTFMWNNIIAFPSAVEVGAKAVLRIVSGRGTKGNLQFALYFVLMLCAGALSEFVVSKTVKFWRDRDPVEVGKGAKHNLTTFTYQLTVDLIKLTTFIAGSLIAAELLFLNPDNQFLAASFVFYTVLIVRIIMILLRLILAPKTPSMRLVTTDDWSAGFIYKNFVILTGIIGVSLYLLQVMNQFQLGEVLPFRFWVGQYFHLSLLYVMWRSRKGISSIIRGEEQDLSPGLERVASWWPVLSMILITVEVFIVHLGMSTGALELAAGIGTITIALIIFLPFFDTALRGFINYRHPTKSEEYPLVEVARCEVRNSYVRIGRIILITLLIISIGKLWGIDYESLAEKGLGAQIAEKGGGFLLILAIGYLVWEITNLWVSRQIARDTPVAVSTAGEGGAGQSRLATVLPLINNTLQVSIVVLTVLLGLSQLGVNITPLLAGAGVFGLAIGFGAQALVKDVVSGIFFLWDDAFRVGEFIDIQGAVGTVEKISIRSLQLRHPNGPVHIIPYGEIPKLTNNSRDYVIMKLRFTVPFDTDLEKVRKLFKEIGQEMMQNQEHAENFIMPFKSQGVVDVDDVGIVIRGKFSTKPGAQWMIRKEIYSRVQKAFDENGIQFARKEVRVQIPGLDDNTNLNPTQKHAIAAAAGEAANMDAAKQGAGTKKEDPLKM